MIGLAHIARLIRDKRAVENLGLLGVVLRHVLVSEPREMDDCQGEAQLGLLSAATHFDPERGFRFSTYAARAMFRKVYRYRFKKRRPYLFADAPRYCDEEFGDVPDCAPDQRFAQIDATQDVHVLMARLTERERDIISRRFGLGCEPQTLEAIGNGLGFTKERTRQLQNRAIRKMRSVA